MEAGAGQRDARRGIWFMFVAYAAGALAASIQEFHHHAENNFEIFRGASFNLVAGRDLYAAYPALYFDRFKYSPSFAFLIGPIAVLPAELGLLVWNLLNAMAVWWVLARLFPAPRALIAMLFVSLELFGSLQTAQSNGLVTALVILAWLSLEEGAPARGAVAVAIGTAVKIFPAAAVTLALFDPRRRRFAAALVAAGLVLALLPLTVTTPSLLADQYRSWHAIEQVDALAGVTRTDPHLIGGVMQQLRLWTGVHWPNWPIQLGGTLLLLLPLAAGRARWPERSFRLRYLASLLIYMVIFNHQAESPSFIIAMSGIAIWYLAVERGRGDLALLIGAFLLTSVASSDLTPHAVRIGNVRPYGVKAIPSIIVWIVLQLELLGLRRVRSEPAEVGQLEPA
jgi:hypothetical protein